MKLRSSQTCCGCASLLVGVLGTCLANLLGSIFLIAFCSSREPVKVIGLTVPPLPQVLLASWALIGIPIVIMAGVSAVYHIQGGLRIYVIYLLLSLALFVCVSTWFLVSGTACDQVVDPEVQRLGSAFVCSFTDAFLLTWTLVIGMVHLYLTYVVWSAAEDITLQKYPRLMRYTDQQYNIQKPSGPPSGLYQLAGDRAEPEDLAEEFRKSIGQQQAGSGPGPMQGSLPPTHGGGGEGGGPPRMPPTSGQVGDTSYNGPRTSGGPRSFGSGGGAGDTGQMGGGIPQSFVPSPSSGVDFTTASVF